MVSGGLKWALGIIVLTLFPKAVGATMRRMTGNNPGKEGRNVVCGKKEKRWEMGCVCIELTHTRKHLQCIPLRDY